MSKKCNYIIDIGDGLFKEIPSLTSELSQKDYLDSMKSYMNDLTSEELENFYRIALNLQSEIIFPENLKNSILSQDNMNTIQFKYPSKYISHFKNKFTDDSNINNIVLLALPESINYQYIPNLDVLILNSTKQLDGDIVTKGLLERYASIYITGNELNISPVELIKNADSKWLEFIGESQYLNFNNIQYLFNDSSLYRDYDILEVLHNAVEPYTILHKKYNNLSEKERLLVYAPTTNTNVIDLSEGDLIKLPNKENFSMFISYSINANGDKIAKIIELKESLPKEVLLPNSIYSKKYTPAPKFVETEYIKATKYLNIDISKMSKEFLEEVLFDTLQRGDIVIIKKSIRSNATNIEIVVKNIQGSNIILEDNSILDISKVVGIKLNDSIHTNLFQKFDTSEEEFLSYSGELSIGDIIKDGDETLRVLKYTNKKLITVNVNTNNIKIINSYSNIKYFASINEDAKIEFNEFLKTPYIESLPINNTISKNKYNLYEYYEDANLNAGDFIVKDTTPYIVISKKNSHIILRDSKGNFRLFTTEILKNSIVYTKNIDPNFTLLAIKYNNFLTDNNINNKTSIAVNIFQNKITKEVVILESTITPDGFTNITNTIKKQNNFLEDSPIFIHKNNEGNFIKEVNNLLPVPITNFNKEILNKLIPGSFIKIKEDFWLVEKIIDDKAILSYGYFEDGKLRSVKKLLRSTSRISEIRLPLFAISLQKELLDLTGYKTKEISLSSTDSPEIIANMIYILEQKFKIKINTIQNSDLDRFPDFKNSRAFIYNGEYFINIDKANIAEPLHEFLHIVLASMKASNYDNYIELVSSIQNHPAYTITTDTYEDITLANLEETFIKLFSETVRHKILVEGVFTEEALEQAINVAIKDMFILNDNINQSLFEVLNTPVKDTLIRFSSELINNSKSLYNKDKALNILGIATTVNKLLQEGKLKENCNG